MPQNFVWEACRKKTGSTFFRYWRKRTNWASYIGEVPALNNGTGWSPGTVFHLIDSLGHGTQMHKLMRDLDILICDDAGKNEIADFIATDSATRRVILIHAKAAQTRLLSASAFADVCNQAVKNLDILTPFSAIEPANLQSWGAKWRASWNKVPQVVDRRIRKGPKSPSEAWQRIRNMIRDPASNREVWIVVGSTFSREEFRDAANETARGSHSDIVFFAVDVGFRCSNRSTAACILLSLNRQRNL